MTKIRVHNPVLGVPITFLNYHDPEQFDILGISGRLDWATSEDCYFFTPPKEELQNEYKNQDKTWRVQNPYMLVNKKPKTIYTRLFIKRRK